MEQTGGCLCGAVRYRVERSAASDFALPLLLVPAVDGRAVAGLGDLRRGRCRNRLRGIMALFEILAGRRARLLRAVRDVADLSPGATGPGCSTSLRPRSTIRRRFRQARKSGSRSGSPGKRAIRRCRNSRSSARRRGSLRPSSSIPAEARYHSRPSGCLILCPGWAPASLAGVTERASQASNSLPNHSSPLH